MEFRITTAFNGYGKLNGMDHKIYFASQLIFTTFQLYKGYMNAITENNDIAKHCSLPQQLVMELKIMI